MNKTNGIIIFAIFSFICIYYAFINYGLVDTPKSSTIIITNEQNRVIDTIQFNTPYKLSEKRPNALYSIPSSLLFNQNPNLLLYILFLSFFSSTSLSLLIPMTLRTSKKLKDLSKKQKVTFGLMSMLIATCVFGICNYVPHVWHPQETMHHLGILIKRPGIVLMIILAPLLLLAALCLFGIFGVSILINNNECTAENVEQSLENYLNYKKILDEYILIFGLFIASGSIIISSALASALNDFILNDTSFSFVPKEFIYIYGLAFTFAILIVYLPVHFKLRTFGESIIKIAHPIDYNNLEIWKKKDDTYLNTLGISGNVWEDTKTSLRVLIPLITSILTSIIGA